jgi:hypothetical protein
VWSTIHVNVKTHLGIHQLDGIEQFFRHAAIVKPEVLFVNTKTASTWRPFADVLSLLCFAHRLAGGNSKNPRWLYARIS